MKKFEIQYVGRLGFDNKEYYAEIIRARTETSTLKKFVKSLDIKKNDIHTKFPELSWWDNEWLMELRNVNEVKEHTCPNCNGTGKIIEHK